MTEINQDKVQDLSLIDSKNATSDQNDASVNHAEEEPGELFKNLPPEVRENMKLMLSSTNHSFGLMPNPLTEKLTEKHIDKILDISAKDDERTFVDTQRSRWFTLSYVTIFVALFVFLTIFLVGADKELYKEAVKLLAVFLGGFGGGFGVKTYMDRDK